MTDFATYPPLVPGGAGDDNIAAYRHDPFLVAGASSFLCVCFPLWKQH